MNKKIDLTDEQVLLGQFYAWLHRRAEHLRKQKAAAGNSGQEDTAATYNTPAKEAGESKVYRDVE